MINFDQEKQLFHLKNKMFSYVIELVRGKYLLHRYWGHALREYRDAAALQAIDRGFSPQPAAYENERTFSLDVLPQEYPAFGHGDFRIPAYQVRWANGTGVSELFYKSHRIFAGKPALQGLPASYAAASEAETLEIELADTQGRMQVFLLYTVFADAAVLVRSTRIVNSGKESFQLLQAASMSLDFSDADFERISLYGGHAKERSITRRPVVRGIETTASARGASSHQHSPFLALVRPDAAEERGEAYGFSLVYSGNFAMQTEVDQFDTTRVTAGINAFNFNWLLMPGESFQTPEVVMAYSAQGLNGMSQAFHGFYREHLLRGKYKKALRPILVNNWEATYFDFDEKKIDEIAACAAGLGIELMVLDDGWFGKRNDDNSSLGDWIVNKKKLPRGIEGLAEKVHGRGMKFGLWFEPEMVSEDSELYRAHPDWILHVPDYAPSFSRHQLVLDLSRPDVCGYIVDAVSKVLASAPIDYVKWDMNRHITEAGSQLLPPERQAEVPHRYMLGLYDVLERITSRFPEVLFESCSGGGGRFDAGMLYYMPQTWASDNTDAICRLKIQYGTSMVFPAITMGAHVSVTPNHQVGRLTPLQTRAFAAMSGDFGYELDICCMSDMEKEAVKKHIELYKRIRPTVQLGSFRRLKSPFTGNDTAWTFTSRDGREVVVMYFRELAEPCAPVSVLRLAGLEEEARYRVASYYSPERMSHDFGGEARNTLEGRSFYGDELMYSGLTIEKIDADFAAYLWILEKEDEQ